MLKSNRIKHLRFSSITTSLVDFPNHVCTIIFTIDCNLRCQFCYNYPLFEENNPPEISQLHVLQELMKRKKYTPFVVISGGEPCIYRDLPHFIKKLYYLGFYVKLDTNGTCPDILNQSIPYLNFISMDLKTHPKKYIKFLPKFSKGSIDPQRTEHLLLDSVDLIINNEFHVPYEFRTTLVPKLVTIDDIRYWAKKVAGCEMYTLKPYINKKTMQEEPILSIESLRFLTILKEYGCKVNLTSSI